MTKKQKDHEIRNIAYTLIWFSLPLIFSGILQQLYNWADAFIAVSYTHLDVYKRQGTYRPVCTS